MLGADHLEHEGLARGVLKGVVHAKEHREHADLPHAHLAGDGEDSQHERL
jgi:hypothetical protein